MAKETNSEIRRGKGNADKEALNEMVTNEIYEIYERKVRGHEKIRL